MMATTTYTTKQTAAIIRNDLRTRWAGHQFSVRCDRGTAADWINLTWTDGPTETAVRNYIDHYHGARFNSQTDSSEQLPAHIAATTPGELPQLVKYQVNGIATHRRHSTTAVRQAAATLAAENAHIAAQLTHELIDTLEYNDLHRQLCTLPIPENRTIRYRGIHLNNTHPITDIGAAIAAALNRTDHTRTATA